MSEFSKFSLDGEWQLTFTSPNGEKISTGITVPSNIEPTLAVLGLVGDYMPADCDSATEPFNYVDDWTYEKVFDAPACPDGHTLHLVFEGIDTISEVYLNGERILDTENMHIAYRVDVTERLKPNGNVLRVIIRSCELWAREHLHDDLSATIRESSYFDSCAYLRKARHSWGWDNAPRLLTSGIVRDVYIEALPKRRFDEVYIYTPFITDDTVRLCANYKYKTCDVSLANHTVKLTLLDGDDTVYTLERQVYFVQGTLICEIPRESIKLWWPRGYGEPYMYTVRLDMIKNGETVATYTSPYGIRTLTLERTEEIDGDIGEFVFIINGERIFSKGTNWKPLSPLCSEADRKTKEGKALSELLTLNCNMVRVWGGGIYEADFFYDFCDRHGLMVWQDFMLACETPPTDDLFSDMMRTEADYVVKKLRNHPSIAVWCGDNENDSFFSYAAKNTEYPPSIAKVTREILKGAVYRNSPNTSYVESSPYISDKAWRSLRNHDGRYSMPENHLYEDSWVFKDKLRESKSRFLSEVGPICMNAIATNRKSFEREAPRAERLWNAPFVRRTDMHQNDDYFITWRTFGKESCLDFYGRDFVFSEFKDYTLALNLICAEIFKDVIEYSRAMYPKRTGILWWSLIDMWPMLFNYSVIDSDYGRKLPYYFIRESQKDFNLIVTREARDGDAALYTSNATLTPHKAAYTVTEYCEGHDARVIACGECECEKNCSKRVITLEKSDTPRLLIIKWCENGKNYANHFIDGKADFPTVKRWVKIIAEAIGESGNIAEL